MNTSTTTWSNQQSGEGPVDFPRHLHRASTAPAAPGLPSHPAVLMPGHAPHITERHNLYFTTGARMTIAQDIRNIHFPQTASTPPMPLYPSVVGNEFYPRSIPALPPPMPPRPPPPPPPSLSIAMLSRPQFPAAPPPIPPKPYASLGSPEALLSGQRSRSNTAPPEVSFNLPADEADIAVALALSKSMMEEEQKTQEILAQEEEDELAKALQASLQEVSNPVQDEFVGAAIPSSRVPAAGLTSTKPVGGFQVNSLSDDEAFARSLATEREPSVTRPPSTADQIPPSVANEAFPLYPRVLQGADAPASLSPSHALPIQGDTFSSDIQKKKEEYQQTTRRDFADGSSLPIASGSGIHQTMADNETYLVNSNTVQVSSPTKANEANNGHDPNLAVSKASDSELPYYSSQSSPNVSSGPPIPDTVKDTAYSYHSLFDERQSGASSHYSNDAASTTLEKHIRPRTTPPAYAADVYPTKTGLGRDVTALGNPSVTMQTTSHPSVGLSHSMSLPPTSQLSSNVQGHLPRLSSHTTLSESSSENDLDSARPGPSTMNLNAFVDKELFLGVSLGFMAPKILNHLVPMMDDMPPIISLPYGKARPLHLQGPSWKHLLKLMAKLSGTRVEPALDAVAITKSPPKLRTVVQFTKPDETSLVWRSVFYFTIEVSTPPEHSRPRSVNDLPYSYMLSNIPTLLRNAADTPVSKTYTIPATDMVPYPTLPISFPELALYLQAALEDSRRYLNDNSSGNRKLAKMMKSCYPFEDGPQDNSDRDRSTVGGLFKRVMGRSSKPNKRSGNEDTYELVTPFVPDEWG